MYHTEKMALLIIGAPSELEEEFPYDDCESEFTTTFKAADEASAIVTIAEQPLSQSFCVLILKSSSPNALEHFFNFVHTSSRKVSVVCMNRDHGHKAGYIEAPITTSKLLHSVI